MAKFEKLDGNKAKLEIEVSKEKFEEAVSKTYNKIKGKFNIPGFRKGKAPRHLIESHYGPGVFYDEAFDEVFYDVYKEAVDEHNLELVSQPDNLNFVVFEPKEKGIIFTVEAFLKPEVELGKYKGIKVEKEIINIKDEDILAELEKVREQNARWIEVTRPVKDGDTVVIDYSGSVDGVKFDGGTAQEQTLVIGSGKFIPGFEEQIIGMEINAEKNIEVKFPENYAPELADKDAVFEIKLHSIKEKELPEIDDDFAQDVSEFENLNDYKADIKKELEKKADMRNKMEMENVLLEEVAFGSIMEIPEVMVESQIDYQLQQLSYQLMYQGMKLEDYFEYMGKSMEEVREEYRASALGQVRMRLAVEALLKELKIEPTQEDMDKKYEELATEAGKTVEEYKEMAGKQDAEYFKERVAMEMLFDYLVDNAEVTEVEKRSEKKEAKTAKKTVKKATKAKEEEKPSTAKKATKETKKVDETKEDKPKKPAKKKTTEE